MECGYQGYCLLPVILHKNQIRKKLGRPLVHCVYQDKGEKHSKRLAKFYNHASNTATGQAADTDRRRALEAGVQISWIPLWFPIKLSVFLRKLWITWFDLIADSGSSRRLDCMISWCTFQPVGPYHFMTRQNAHKNPNTVSSCKTRVCTTDTQKERNSTHGYKSRGGSIILGIPARNCKMWLERTCNSS